MSRPCSPLAAADPERHRAAAPAAGRRRANLREAYLFLRRLENLLQSINDEQTQTLLAMSLTGRVCLGHACGRLVSFNRTAGCPYGRRRAASLTS
uniref:[protein-PII] uridylyltransferase family protein n=1 Tax=Enterobacter asburiae TaxID=61645 RepID=UPI002A23FA0A|nr:hypothetical protein [Enterobacter asburiae]